VTALLVFIALFVGWVSGCWSIILRIRWLWKHNRTEAIRLLEQRLFEPFPGGDK